MNKVLFSKKTDNWETPIEIKELFYGAFDPCPLNPKFDGLKIKWQKYNFVNPPYSDIRSWLEKGIQELHKNGNESVFLVPARTDTKWFHDLVYGFFRIKFIQGRLKFGNSKNSAPFPSMFIYLLKEND